LNRKIPFYINSYIQYTLYKIYNTRNMLDTTKNVNRLCIMLISTFTINIFSSLADSWFKCIIIHVYSNVCSFLFVYIVLYIMNNIYIILHMLSNRIYLIIISKKIHEISLSYILYLLSSFRGLKYLSNKANVHVYNCKYSKDIVVRKQLLWCVHKAIFFVVHCVWLVIRMM
jgi:hypothetical protein